MISPTPDPGKMAQPGEAEAVAWKPVVEILTDQIVAIRDEYKKLRQDFLDQMEWHASQGEAEEVSEYSTGAERHAAALLATNRILDVVDKLTAAGRDATPLYPASALSAAYARAVEDAAGESWHPLTCKGDRMTCPLPADETVVEVMLKDGTICSAWYSCNIMEAGDWDFLPVKDDGEPDNEVDSIADDIAAWRPIRAADGWNHDMDAAPRKTWVLLYIIGHGCFQSIHDGAGWVSSKRNRYVTKAVAWRPLPAPPKGGN